VTTTIFAHAPGNGLTTTIIAPRTLTTTIIAKHHITTASNGNSQRQQYIERLQLLQQQRQQLLQQQRHVVLFGSRPPIQASITLHVANRGFLHIFFAVLGMTCQRSRSCEEIRLLVTHLIPCTYHFRYTVCESLPSGLLITTTSRINALVIRSLRLTDQYHLHEEEKQLKRALLANGYPEHAVKGVFKRARNAPSTLEKKEQTLGTAFLSRISCRIQEHK
ncbi:hypothetical protein L9F63_025656, partial [Diploptera punctata]